MRRVMGWRVVAFAKGDEVWYQAQYRVRWFWHWTTEGYWDGPPPDPIRYDTPMAAQAAAINHLDQYKSTYRGVLRSGKIPEGGNDGR